MTSTGTRDFICDPSESRREGKKVKGREGEGRSPCPPDNQDKGILDARYHGTVTSTLVTLPIITKHEKMKRSSSLDEQNQAKSIELGSSEVS